MKLWASVLTIICCLDFQAVQASYKCRAIYAPVNKFDTSKGRLESSLGKAILQVGPLISKKPSLFSSRPSLEEIRSQAEFLDSQNLNDYVWSLHPEYSFLRIETKPAGLDQKLDQEYFLSVFGGTAFENYLRVTSGELKKMPSKDFLRTFQFLDSILFRSEQNELATYSEFDFIRDSQRTKVIDFNLRTRSNSYLDESDHWALYDYMNFLKEVYIDRLGLNDSQMETLFELTRSLIERTTLIQKDRVKKDGFRYVSTETKSGLIAVESQSSNEKLPLEILHDISARELMKLPDSTGLVEIGRFSKGKTVEEETSDLVQLITVSIAARPYVKYALIEVDRPRRRLWRSLGFEDLDLPASLARGEFYKSGTDYLMYVPIETLIRNVFPNHQN